MDTPLDPIDKVVYIFIENNFGQRLCHSEHTPQLREMLSNHGAEKDKAIESQAAEIERLKSELQEKNKFVSDAISACSKSGLEIGRLREALEFYANPDTYRQLMEKEPYGETWIDTPKGSPLDIQDMDELGAGVIAREALQPQEVENA